MEVVRELEQRGCRPVDSVDELNDGEILVIRSHGVPQSVIDELEKRCRIQGRYMSVRQENTQNGIVGRPENDLVLIAGNKKHPEVCGIIGHCKAECHTFNNEEELDEVLSIILKSNNKQVLVVAQTTFDTKEWKKCIKKIKSYVQMRKYLIQYVMLRQLANRSGCNSGNF